MKDQKLIGEKLRYVKMNVTQLVIDLWWTRDVRLDWWDEWVLFVDWQ